MHFRFYFDPNPIFWVGCQESLDRLYPQASKVHLDMLASLCSKYLLCPECCSLALWSCAPGQLSLQHLLSVRCIELNRNICFQPKCLWLTFKVTGYQKWPEIQRQDSNPNTDFQSYYLKHLHNFSDRSYTRQIRIWIHFKLISLS